MPYQFSVVYVLSTKMLKRGMFSMAHKLLIDPVISPAINGLRQELGQPKVSGIMVDWWHSPGRTLATWWTRTPTVRSSFGQIVRHSLADSLSTRAINSR